MGLENYMGQLHAASIQRQPHPISFFCQLTHMTEPGQWPAGSRVTVKLSGGRSQRPSTVMATGYSMGSVLRYGARPVNSGSFKSRDWVTSEQKRFVFLLDVIGGLQLEHYRWGSSKLPSLQSMVYCLRAETSHVIYRVPFQRVYSSSM